VAFICDMADANGARFDMLVAVEHPRSVRSVLRRALAAWLGLMLTGGPIGLCAAVMPTPEGRMACCTGKDKCPMHDGATDSSASHHRPTQSQADQCCVASERDTPNQSMPMTGAGPATPVLGTSVLLPLHVPALVRTDAWRTATPLLVTPVPRHLLLAVFLV
jgi:hypothetical protein